MNKFLIDQWHFQVFAVHISLDQSFSFNKKNGLLLAQNDPRFNGRMKLVNFMQTLFNSLQKPLHPIVAPWSFEE